MLVRSESNLFKVSREIIPLEVASDYLQVKRISGGNYKSLRPEVIFNASSWLSIKHLFDRDIKVILNSPGFIRNLYLSLYLSN